MPARARSPGLTGLLIRREILIAELRELRRRHLSTRKTAGTLRQLTIEILSHFNRERLNA
ncbi:hypothetical protein HOY34_20495 [Xinfangfangia sp. D13-10-4-6]|uniref:hypothetical protein n=1 Tax=Pseudogemmobacter hezensis TaxID=2737662 RepID=UPI00155166CE|nr:hypothetical protein [Pseudogemmobacter hezensis]NPD17568.1 hypothetical protein [Pseudogemmobacter hezensis]